MKGDFHKRWQDYFPKDCQEVRIGNRRADVLIENSRLVVEVQHSRIRFEEVESRNKDYSDNGKKVIWVVDGEPEGCDVEVTERSSEDGSSSFLLVFMEKWPQTSFSGCDVMLVSTTSGVFSVSPSDIRFGVVHALDPVSEEEVVSMMKDVTQHEHLFAVKQPPKQSKIYVYDGAPGSGKSWFLANTMLNQSWIDYAHYDTFLCLTKPHSAKEVLKKEMMEVARTLGLEFVTDEVKLKAYIMRFLKGEKLVTIIVATLDSLIHTMRLSDGKGGDPFLEMCKEINQHGPRGVSSRGTIRFKGATVQLGGKTLIVVDEATKAFDPYAKAIAKLLFNTNGDAIFTGDILQSIESSENCLTWLRKNTFPFAEHELKEKNEIRRFGPKNVQFLVDVMGGEATYKKHGKRVPVSCKEVDEDGDSIPEVHSMDNIKKSDETHDKKISDNIEKVMAHFAKDVEEMHLLPNHVLMVFPHVNDNAFANALEDKLHEFWASKLDDEEYKAKMFSSSKVPKEETENFFAWYEENRGRVWMAKLHRSEGQSIDTSTSTYVTRMVSIHASQGDGRRLSYLLQLSQWRLECFTKLNIDETNLQYESLINVACSRQKEKLKVFVERNKDDVWRRFSPYMNESTRNELPVTYYIPKHFTSKNLLLDEETDVVDVVRRRVKDRLEEENKDLFDKPLIDFGDHVTRGCVFKTMLFLQMMRYESEDSRKKQQFRTIIDKISKKTVNKYKTAWEYRKFMKKSRCCFPVLQYKGWETTCDKIVEKAKSLQSRLGDPSNLNSVIEELTPAESVLLWHMIDLNENGLWVKTPLKTVFRAFDGQDLKFGEHLSCLSSINEIVKEMLSLQGEWKLNHYVRLGSLSGGETKDFQFGEKFEFLNCGESANTGFLILPSVDDFNIDDVVKFLIGSTISTKQPDTSNGGNVDRFENKRMRCCIIGYSDNKKLWIDVDPDTFQGMIDILASSVRFRCKRLHKDVVGFVDFYEDFSQEATKKPMCKSAKYVERALDELDYLSSNPAEETILATLEEKLEKGLGKFKDSVLGKRGRREEVV